MSLHRTRCWVASLVLTAGAGGFVRGDEPVTTERVARVWSEREETVKTGRFKWTAIETRPKKYASLFMRVDDTFDRDLTLKATCTVTIDGRKLRYERDGQMWSVERNALEPCVTVSTFDGQLFGHAVLQSAVSKTPQSTIKTAGAPEEMRNAGMLPVWYSLRGSLVVSESLSITRYRPSGRRVVVNGRPCHEFVQGSSTGSQTHLYLDAERAFQVVRRVVMEKGQVGRQTDVTYQPNHALGWVPKTWEYVWRASSGDVITSHFYTMSEVSINPDVEAGTFAPVTPPGARVADFTSGKEVQYGILPDGTKGRDYDASRRSPSQDELMMRPRWSARSWLFWVTFVAGWLVVIGAVLAYRWYSRSRAPVDLPKHVGP